MLILIMKVKMMKKRVLVIFIFIILLIGFSFLFLPRAKEGEELIVDKFNSVDLNGYTPEYNDTVLEIENDNFYVSIIEDVDDNYYLFSLTELEKGKEYTYYCSPLLGDNEQLLYYSASMEKEERRFLGIYPDNVVVKYKGETDFFEYKTIKLKINGIKYDYTIWNMELSKNEEFSKELIIIE